MGLKILKDSSVTKIYLVYGIDDNKQKVSIKLRFSNDTDCYFVTEKTNNIYLPQENSDAQIVVYTTDGVYKNNTIIHHIDTSASEITFEVKNPKSWEYEQLRKSSRIVCKLPLSIKFADNSILETNTYDISSGGVSFYLNHSLDTVQKSNPCNLVLQIPCEATFSAQTLGFEAKFIRERQEGTENLFYVLNFININPETQKALRVVMMRLES